MAGVEQVETTVGETHGELFARPQLAQRHRAIEIDQGAIGPVGWGFDLDQ